MELKLIKMFVLLYANDTVIFGTSEENFRHNLNIFYEYSKTWKLDPRTGVKKRILRKKANLTCNYLKQDLNIENYLINLDKKHYLSPIKFRTGNHRLPVETGRWENLPLNERKCHLCTKNDIGDEYHYLFCCCYFESERKRLLKPMCYRNHNMLKFRNLLNSNNVSTLKRLSEFTRIIMDKFTS